MRQEYEKNLVGLANDILNRFCRVDLQVMDVSSGAFFEGLRQRDFLWQPIENFVTAISNAKLANFISVRLHSESNLKEAHFLQTFAADVTVSTQLDPEGHKQVVALAMPVIIAAMYDILITEKVLLQGPRPNGYVPKKALATYVKQHRMKALAVH